ncbi:patatin-like phospholipase family protein [Streptomyces sp. NPDC047002]|uniref:patatin-like phospholipase family protein n=1 Tax=Streptomyces sp. NPDC047002 TaxID=3155475 RepID=UPI003455FB4B
MPGVAEVLARRLRDGGGPGRRSDPYRLALAVEGGTSRGAVATGMLLALDELGAVGAFDAVYGASVGALGAAWLLAGRIAEGARTWWDPVAMGRVMNPRNLLRGRRFIDLDPLVGEGSPLTADALWRVLAHGVAFHPLATDAATGRATDLAPYVRDVPTLRTALRASTAVPLLAGGPVRLAGRRYIDAGMAEPLPYRTALAQGASHVLLLRTRPATDLPAPPPLVQRLLVPWVLRRGAAGTLPAWYAQHARRIAEEADLAAHPRVLSVRPAADAPAVGIMERDPRRLREAVDTGRAALLTLHAAVSGREHGGAAEARVP